MAQNLKVLVAEANGFSSDRVLPQKGGLRVLKQRALGAGVSGASVAVSESPFWLLPGPLVDEGESALVSASKAVFLEALPRSSRFVTDLKMQAKGFEQRASQPVTRQGDQAVMLVDACQQPVDRKAFTGRGEGRSVRVLVTAIEQLHERMSQLAQDSRQFGKGQLYLTVHVRGLTGQHALRWRGLTVKGSSARYAHLSWDEAMSRIQQQPYTLQQRFLQWNQLAQQLNGDEVKARLELKRERTKAQKAEAALQTFQALS